MPDTQDEVRVTISDAIAVLTDWLERQPRYQGEDARSVHYIRNRAALEMAIKALSHTQSAAHLQAHLDMAVAALEDVQSLLADAAIPAIVDRDQEVNMAVKQLGDRIGYGALMTTASAIWGVKLAAQGLAGAEFVCSTCRKTAGNARDKIKSTLTAIKGEDHD